MLALLLATFAAAAVASAAAPHTASSPPRPNLIFLLMDDMDFNSLTVMPNFMRRFRTEGTEFVNAYVSSPKCCPSRTSLLSGRFAASLGDTTLGWCGDFMQKARYNETFFAAAKQQGYRTAYAGKYVNRMLPQLCANPPVVPVGFDIAAGDAFIAMCNESAYYNIQFNLNGKLHTTGTSPADYLTSFVGNLSIPWLRTAAAQSAQPGGAPFMAVFAPHAPHFPAEPAPWYANAPLPSQQAPRTPAFGQNCTANKSWAIRENPPFDSFTEAGIDHHFRNRQRTILSVDDFVHDIFEVLEATGADKTTIVLTSTDHAYHLGQWGIPFEKSTPYQTDINVPFFARGPGVVAGGVAQGLVSLLDVGATFLELSGAVAPGAPRVTDGRSLTPILGSGGGTGAPPPGWRDRVLVQHEGEVNQWMTICGWVNNATCTSPANPADVPYLIDGPQNTWAFLRIINSTHDIAYGEWRPQGTPNVRANTNWTELYDIARDPWEKTNLAVDGPHPIYSSELWAIANCANETCP